MISNNHKTRKNHDQRKQNKWSVIINIALTTLTAILSALGFSVG